MWQPFAKDITGIKNKYRIPDNVIINLVSEDYNVKDSIGLEDGENFFSKEHLSMTYFPLDYNIHAFLPMTKLVPV